MADDIGFQPIQQQPADDVGFQPIPKMPDTSGVQKMAQENLAANDNKEVDAEPKPPQTPAERLNTAVGMPVGNLLNPDDTTSITAPIRKQYTKMLQNGDAVNFGDAAQTILHSVASLIGGAAQRTQAAGRILEQGRQGVGEGYEGGAIFPTPIESNIQTMIGAAGNIVPQALSAGYSAFQKMAVQTGQEIGIPSIGRDIAILPEAIIGAEGMTPHVPELLKDSLAKRANKPADSIAPPDFDQAAQAINHKAPSGADFKAVETVTNGALPEKSLHIVFNETGIKPDQVFEDAKRDPQVAADIAAGKVPEKYEPFIEPKPTLRTEQAEKLTVARDEATRSFTVVDKDGDQVQSGFDSHEEAQHYIEDEKFKAEERAAIEEEGKTKPVEKVAELVSAPTETLEKSFLGRIKEKLLGKDNQAALAGEPEGTSNLESSAAESGRPISSTRPIVSPGTHEPFFQTSDARPPEGVFTTRAMSPSTSEGGLIKSIETSYHNTNDSETIKSKSKQSANDLSNLLKYITDKVNGSQFDSTRVKNDAGIERKLKFKEPDKISDFLGGRIFVDSRQAADAILAQLKSNANVIHIDDFLNDEGKYTGYRAIHAQIMGENGISAEVQIQPLEISEAQNEAHKFYKEMQQHIDANEITRAEEAGDKAKSIYDSAWNKFKERLTEFSKSQAGSGITFRKMIGNTITAAEKFAGKLTGGLFEKLADGYIKTFQPELMGDKALRADAYLAKFKATLQEAENAYYRQSAESKAAFDKLTPNERMQWLYDHETGRWDAELDPDHARYQALYDAMHKSEQEAIGAETAYKENYLPHQWENPEAVTKFFRSDAMIKKYGADWFKKASEFKLIQEGIRAGFKLKTDNPESMLVARQLASHSMIATMDLLKDMESSGIAKKATTFGIDKKIAKTENAIIELQEKYKKEFEKKNNPNQPALIEGLLPAESKVMKVVEDRLNDLKERLDNFKKEKSDNKLTPEQMTELKGGFRVIGPDSKVWNIDQQVGPLWKNAMEMKGLWENQGVLGDAYRSYIQAKAIWTQVKLGLSLFHPVHVAMINLASGIASSVEHLIQGGKFSDLALRDTGITMGLTKEILKLQDHPAVQAWNTAPDVRTPEQHAMVTKMLEGGFKPTMSARDTVHFKENFDKAIAGVGLNNLRLIHTAISLPGALMKPFFEHWIPGMKSEIYLRRCDDAVARDPSLIQDAGKRGEVFRQIAKDTDRTYGEMNSDVQFWNRNVRDSFNAAFISGGWKLAQIYNAKGLLESGKIAYKFAKTGEFNKADITHNMLQAYTYTALTLALGGAINAALGNPMGTAKDTIWDMVKNLVAPQTGEKNPDGTPIRLNQPAFAKEGYNIAHEINTKGLMAGTGSFLYHQTLIPGIVDTLNNRDFTGRELISDPTDLHQWINAGWDSVSPIAIQGYERAEAKHSDIGKVAGVLGFPTAGAYLNQTPFEQKVIAKYDEQNPPKGNAYEAKLKTNLKSEIAKGDNDAAEKTRQRMKEEGMSSEQIARAEHVYTKPFAEDAWKKLPSEDQRRLIDSASEEEKKKFKVKPD